MDGAGRPMVLSENVEFNTLLRRGVECLRGLGMGVELLDSIECALNFKEKALSD